MELTQTDVGAICGVRFQQIQKYESATNHISAAMLWRLAVGLGVGIQYFYDGLDRADKSAPGRWVLADTPPTELKRSASLQSVTGA
jgi:transcriptional regulator with XRE-family HTH domain